MSKDEIEETLRDEINIDFNNFDVNDDIDSLPIPEEFAKQEINPFVFPKCQISESTVTLVDLIEATLNEACSGDSFSAMRLVTTTRNIFQMYCDVLPIAHREVLEKLPQASALAYNNYMYLAHKAMTVGTEILLNGKRLPKPLSTNNVSLADLVLELRQAGAEIFLQQMRTQRDQLRAILRDSSSGLGQLSGDALLPSSAEKCIRQVSHQMTHLRNVWQSVLPACIYKRAAGTVFNSVIEELIEKVVALEDIAADSANQISQLYGSIKENGPEIFVFEDKKESKTDVVIYVKKWTKFCELIRILNASLREIDDRWSNGKGPLATVFAPEEVKRLIRALFQNTDRRAEVLSRIKL